MNKINIMLILRYSRIIYKKLLSIFISLMLGYIIFNMSYSYVSHSRANQKNYIDNSNAEVKIVSENINNENKKKNYHILNEEMDIMKILKRPTGSCKKLVELGGVPFCNLNKEGEKKICLDDYLWKSSQTCTVFSFGVLDDISFEEALTNLIPTCLFYLFDPIINDTLTIGNKIMQHKNFHLYEYGLHGSNLEVFYKQILSKRKLLTFSNILRLVGEENITTISYLKMDVEYQEWSIFNNMLKENKFQNVNQLGVELHFMQFIRGKPKHVRLKILQEKYDLLQKLETIAKFRRISFDVNQDLACTLQIGRMNYHLCGEILYIKDKNYLT